ncbi:oxidoreductase [Streptomyces sp. NPDC088387]|uniref:oxidoreductase n=1 Tax=Streptomyces sp. NPDC088387 TaxID=3365859 RepID=UPI003817F837
MIETLNTSPSWDASHMPDLSGRTAIVTGANSGIGFETAFALTRAGAHVVLAVRDRARGEAAAARMPGSTEVRHLDLADLASVHEFADTWSSPIDLLVNNAGVSVDKPGRTKDGFEILFGTNHLGPFALTNRLLPYISGRIVTVASGAHRMIDEVAYTSRPDLSSRQGLVRAYGRSKLANLLFTLELQHRLSKAGSQVRALAAHPGLSSTNLWSGINPVARAVFAVYARFYAQDARSGALPTLYAATQDLPGASYVGPDGKNELKGAPTLVGRTPTASDPTIATQLWDLSEELTGVQFSLTGQEDFNPA